MPHTIVRVLVHLVWATWDRTRRLDQEVEAIVRNAIATQASRLHCPLHAFGASDEHVHVLIELEKKVAIASLVRALKGASGHDVTRMRPDLQFRWQSQGYGAFSVSERDPGNVVDYIRSQRERHRSGDLAAEWESTAVAHE